MYSWIEKGYSKRADRTDGKTFYRRSYPSHELEIVHDIEENKESKLSLVVSSTGVIRCITSKNVKSFKKKQVRDFVEKLERLAQEDITFQKWIEEIGPLDQIMEETLR